MVVANAKVSGGHWSSTCGGSSSSGHHWYRIVSVNGKSVSKLYGRQYVYAKTGTLRGVTVTPLQAACGGVRLRTSASTTATSKVTLADGARVTSTGSVTGGSWIGKLHRRRRAGARPGTGSRRSAARACRRCTG